MSSQRPAQGWTAQELPVAEISCPSRDNVEMTARREDTDVRFLRRIEKLGRELLAGKYPGGAQQLWDLQLRLLDLQRAIQREIATTKRTPRSPERAATLERLQWARWQARHLGDAYAWVLLGLDSQTLVPLGENTPGSVPPDSVGMQGVLAIAQTLGSNGAGFPIVNDITDCLRIGDITFVEPTANHEREIATVEVKSRLVSEQIHPDGGRSAKLSIEVHSISRTDLLGKARARIPVGEEGASVTPPRRLPDRRLEQQVRRMSRATERQSLEPNAIGEVDGKPFISLDLQLDDGSEHWSALRRAIRRARRNGLAVEAADEAFVYIAVYDPLDLTAAIKLGLAGPSFDELQKILPPEQDRDARDAIVINHVLPPVERRQAYASMPYFLASIPKTSIFDLMNRRMAIVVVVNPGWIARSLESEGFSISIKPRGGHMPEFQVSCAVADAKGNKFRLTMPGFDHDLHEALANFRSAPSLVQKYVVQRDALTALLPDLVETKERARQAGVEVAKLDGRSP